MDDWICSWERKHAAQGEEAHCARTYSASASEVAAKKLLNYLRRFTKDRPTIIEVSNIKKTFCFTVEWTTIKRKGVLGVGVKGEWYNILSSRRKT